MFDASWVPWHSPSVGGEREVHACQRDSAQCRDGLRLLRHLLVPLPARHLAHQPREAETPACGRVTHHIASVVERLLSQRIQRPVRDDSLRGL